MAPHAHRPHVIGVRHHSPACAHLTAHTIRRLRPEVVLIEGPADMNDRVDELLLGHRLPVAILTHRLGGAEGQRSECSWTPLCEHSPEWQALVVGREVGAEVRFMDLPAWHAAFSGVQNRYGDHGRRQARVIGELCARFKIDHHDVLWEHLFEGDIGDDPDMDRLAERLRRFFVALRGEERADDRDRPREEMMVATVRAALARSHGAVVVVCGGYHAPALVGLEPATDAAWPVLQAPADACSYLVPWSFHRLDAFTGYESGMPSPGYCDAVFREGPARAAEVALEQIAARLRERGQRVSAADLIAAMSMAEGLARLRGHATLRRTDLLDGMAAAIIKEALERPLPWSEPGALGRLSDTTAVAMLAVLSGERTGRLHPDTPRPALLADVEETLAALELGPQTAPRVVRLALHEPRARQRSQALHRLRLLQIPGFTRQSGPAWVTDAETEECWLIARSDLAESTLIEAAALGSTLEAAARRKIEEALHATESIDLAALATLLRDALLAGIPNLAERAVSDIRRHVMRESDLGQLGVVLTRLLGLSTEESLLAPKGFPELADVIGAAVLRGAWLLENFTGQGPSADGRALLAVMALRDAAACGLGDGVREVFARCAAAQDVPTDVRGACLGALWSLGGAEGGEWAADAAVRHIRPGPELGDFVAGLFALARLQTVSDDRVLGLLDEVVAGFPDEAFLAALPALRMAFAWFSPRERVAVAERIAGRHGVSVRQMDILNTHVDHETFLRARKLDLEVERVLRRYGLLEDEP